MAAKSVEKTVDDARVKIANLNDELRTITQAPVSATEVEAGIDRYIAHQAKRYDEARLVDRLASRGVIDSLAANDPEAFACFFHAAAIKSRLMDCVAERVSDGLTAGERDKRVANIKAALYAAEVAEESAITQAEAAGQTITRRADADPRAVLADTQSD